MTTKETVNALQIAELAGVAIRNYAHRLMLVDPDFPRPIITQKGSAVSWWFKDEIIVYLAKKAAKPKPPVGRKAVKLQAVRRNALDLTLAKQFISSRK